MKLKKIRNLFMINWQAVLILFIGCAITSLLVVGDEKELLSKISAPALSVETMKVQKTDYQIQVPAWGFVEPREIIEIRTEISGKVNHISKNIFAGSKVTCGDHLFSLDERAYKNSLTEASATMEQAMQALAIEKGRQIIAKSEWNLLEKSKWHGDQNKSLALRKPQLKEKEAALQIATAKQAQAALDIERTRIMAPCDGVIINEDLAVGQILDTGDTALQLACTDCYQLKAMFSPEYSLNIAVKTASIEIGENRYAGVVKAVLPQINPKTRQKQALVQFKGRQLYLGDYAFLQLPGQRFKDIIVIPKNALRPETSVWILSKFSTLKIQKVTILAQDMQYVVIGEGLANGDKVIISHISSPLQDMPLRVRIHNTKGIKQIATISMEQRG